MTPTLEGSCCPKCHKGTLDFVETYDTFRCNRCHVMVQYEFPVRMDGMTPRAAQVEREVARLDALERSRSRAKVRRTCQATDDGEHEWASAGPGEWECMNCGRVIG